MKTKILIPLLALVLVTFSAWAVTVYWFSAAPQAVTLAVNDIFLIERPSPHTNLHVTAGGIVDSIKTYTHWPSAVGYQGITFPGGATLSTNGTNLAITSGSVAFNDLWLSYDSVKRSAGFGPANTLLSNTWFGVGALNGNTGSYANGFGYAALQGNTGAYANGFGYYALHGNTGASANGFGYYALYGNTGAYANGFGYYALYGNTGASANGFGYYALYGNTGANANGFGYAALYGNTGAYANGFGHAALNGNTGANANGFGYAALQGNTGAYANGFGHAALNGNTGAYANGFGYYALQGNTGASANGFGYYALQGNTGAYANGFGYYALYANGPGTLNTGFGHQSGQNVRSVFLATFSTSEAFTNASYTNVTALNVGADHGLVTNTTITVSHSSRPGINGVNIVIATNETQVVISNAFSSTFNGRVNWGTVAQNNLYLGGNSASNVTHAVKSVYIGSGAGPGTANTRETNKLYIAVNPGEPLIGGDFGAKRVTFDGSLWVRATPQASTNFVPDSDTATIYAVLNGSGQADLWVMNEAGTRTQLSPHAKDAPEWLYDEGDPDALITCEVQMFLGTVRWHNKSREAALKQREWDGEDIKAMDKPARTVLFTESFAEFNARTGESLAVLDWDAVQAQRQAVYAAKVAAAAEPLPVAPEETGDGVEAKTLEANPLATKTVLTVEDIRKPAPEWLAKSLLSK